MDSLLVYTVWNTEMKDIRGEYVKMGVEFPIFMLVLTDNE